MQQPLQFSIEINSIYSLQESEQRCEQRLNFVIGLKNVLELLPPLARALEGVSDPLLFAIREVRDPSWAPINAWRKCIVNTTKLYEKSYL